MKSQVSLILSLAMLPMALLQPTVFLAAGGSRICTLQNVGEIPSGAGFGVHPVYQKVCRDVVGAVGPAPYMMDESDDISDEEDEKLQKIQALILAKARKIAKSKRHYLD